MGCHCGDGLVQQTLGRLERFVGLSSTMCHGGVPTVIRRPRWKASTSRCSFGLTVSTVHAVRLPGDPGSMSLHPHA